MFSHRIDGLRPSPIRAVLNVIDRPGMIGRVGTILGSARINIASMQVGRSEKAGNQMMVLAVESEIPQDVLEQLKAVDGILGATMVNFESLKI